MKLKGNHMNQNDVYSYGIVTPSTLLMLKWPFPQADNYAEVTNSFHMTGGEACNSSIVLSKLNINVALDGLWFGDNKKAIETLNLISSFGIDTTLINVVPGFENIEELVIADTTTRTIFASYGKLLEDKVIWNTPSEDSIKKSKVVCLDPFLKEDSIYAAKLCIKHSIPYVTVDCKYDSFISKNAHINIISDEFRKGNYNNIETNDLLQTYIDKSKGITIFTSADKDIIYSYNNEIKSFAPYKVKTTDTTGAGDSFRSGIIYGLLHNYTIEHTIAFASLLASYVCQSFPGVINSPNYEELITFSKEQGYDYVQRYSL